MQDRRKAKAKIIVMMNKKRNTKSKMGHSLSETAEGDESNRIGQKGETKHVGYEVQE